MSDKRKLLTVHQLKNLMLEALSTEDDTLLPEEHTFKKYAYSGTQYALFRMTEALAIQKKLIPSNINLSTFAWGVTGSNLFENHNTNFTRKEIEYLLEAFYLLLNQNIIAPGIYGEAYQLPSFHVTDHGHECLRSKEILPYDYEGYLSQIKSINKMDLWVEKYLTEGLRCFNAGCYQASVIMIGLSSEKIVLDLIEEFENFIARNTQNTIFDKKLKVNQNPLNDYKNKIANSRNISSKYSTFEDYFDHLLDTVTFKNSIDRPARNTFLQYIRLNRNEVTHANEIEKNETETMLLFVSFIKYVDLQTQLLVEIRNA